MAGLARLALAAVIAMSPNAVAPSSGGSFASAAAQGYLPRSANEILVEERAALAQAGVRGFDELASAGCTTTIEPPDVAGPIAEALSSLEWQPTITQACCKICTAGKACGNTCISARYTCHVGGGCACNGGGAIPVIPDPSPSVVLRSQSPYPRVRVGETATLSLAVDALWPLWNARDVELRVTNMAEAGIGLRGWDERGLIAYNTPDFVGQRFNGIVQALAPGVHRVRVGLFHRTLGQIGPNGIYWDVAVDAISGIARLYEGWHSRYSGQSPYIAMHPRDVASFWIRFTNVGTETWDRGVWGRQVNLALNGDDKRPYELGMAADWLWDDRIATTTARSVGPGQVAEFRFSVRAPAVVGTYTLALRPVADGTTWLEDEGVFWVIEVR